MKNFLNYASAKYYQGQPVITDAEFDTLAEEHNYSSVGFRIDKGVKHHYPMFSLQKAYVGESSINLEGEVCKTTKLDGAAVSLLYLNGKLVQGLTRGDGIKGHDITDKCAKLVPILLTNYPPILQVVGEVVAPKRIPNARNYAAGALNLKSLDEFMERRTNLRFIAYGVGPFINEKWSEDMYYLEKQCFLTVNSNSNLEEYPSDGLVFRVNDNFKFESLGYTSKHPRGAYALKERAEGVVTTLNGVDWQVGRTGAVSPVAILEPVMIEDAEISRATLHNIKYIEELDLEIGCKVEIIRSGDIIPRVVKRAE